MSDRLDSTHRHVLISGGSRGLGQAIAEGLLAAGYRVSTFSRRATPFTDGQRGNEQFFFSLADVARHESLPAFLEQATAKFGAPFGLVNCAGVAVDGVLATMAEEEIDRVVSINLTGAFHLTRLVVREMLLVNQGGSIINVSSIVGSRGYRGLTAYSATKAGLDGMTRALARELGDRRIRVNSLAPGYIDTEMTSGMDDRQREQIIRRTPLGRLGSPEDIVGPTLFLLSDAARFITGQVLVVDGGMTV